MMQKLVTIVREDLTAGQKAVQSTHAAVNFIFEYPNKASPWFKDSNILVQLEADIGTIERVMEKCEQQFLSYTVFREPDLGNIITAICIEPNPISTLIVKRLKLLLKEKEYELK